MYAMYVIGQVESNHNWAAINRNDPITLGMMQWYGGRAGNLLKLGGQRDPTGYATCKANDGGMIAAVESGRDMTGYYCNDADAVAWAKWAATDKNHEFQQEQWNADYANYETLCTNYGFPANNQRERIFFMTMYHQGPKYALQVLGAVSATATLGSLHSACLANRVLGKYANRYNTAYNLLKDWDGTSAPPDFGQIEAPGTGGDSQPDAQPTPAQKMWIIQQGDNLYLTQDGKRYEFKKTTAQNWIYNGKAGTSVDDSQTTEPSAPTGDDRGAKVVAWVRERLGRFNYSQAGGRLNPDATGYTDCSGLLWRAYQDVTGINVGTWTGQMIGLGKLIADQTTGVSAAQAKVHAGDLLILDWRSNGQTSSYDHVEIFTTNGGAELYSHGGPGKGPVVRSFAGAASAAVRWQIRRYV